MHCIFAQYGLYLWMAGDAWEMYMYVRVCAYVYCTNMHAYKHALPTYKHKSNVEIREKQREQYGQCEFMHDKIQLHVMPLSCHFARHCGPLSRAWIGGPQTAFAPPGLLVVILNWSFGDIMGMLEYLNHRHGSLYNHKKTVINISEKNIQIKI